MGGFSSHKINDIFTHNPKVFTSLYADHESTAEHPVSDLDARLFFLIKECDFTTNEIVKYPLLLTMDFYVLKERAIFLKWYNQLEGQYLVTGAASDSLADLDVFCAKLGIERTEYLSFVRQL